MPSTLMYAPSSYRHVNPIGVPFSGPSYRPRIRRKAGPIVNQLKARIAKVESLQRSRPRRKGGKKRSGRKNPPRGLGGRFIRSSSRRSSSRNAPRRSSGRRRSSGASTIIVMPRKANRPRRRSGRKNPGHRDSLGRFIGSGRRRGRKNPPREATGLRALWRMDTWVQVGQGVLGFSAAIGGPISLAMALGNPQWNQGWRGVGASAVSSVGAGFLAGIVSRRAGRNVLMGGLLATAIRAIVQFWPAAGAWLGVSVQAAPSAPAPRAPRAPGRPAFRPTGPEAGRLSDYLTMDSEARGQRDYVAVPGINGQEMDDYADVLRGEDLDDYADVMNGMDGMGADDYLTVGETSAYSAREQL